MFSISYLAGVILNPLHTLLYLILRTSLIRKVALFSLLCWKETKVYKVNIPEKMGRKMWSRLHIEGFAFFVGGGRPPYSHRRRKDACGMDRFIDFVYKYHLLSKKQWLEPSQYGSRVHDANHSIFLFFLNILIGE